MSHSQLCKFANNISTLLATAINHVVSKEGSSTVLLHLLYTKERKCEVKLTGRNPALSDDDDGNLGTSNTT
ncbi:hypothetical protein TcYC6_0025860 [Trypanosoma cruzi]|nr:hypothetical protein TcYC6_0025860 [Trypanosoma cruzi]